MQFVSLGGYEEDHEIIGKPVEFTEETAA